MRTLWPYLVLAAIAGCGEVVSNNPDASGDGPIGGDPDDGLRSGTRLKLQWYDFGGTRIANGQRDTMRDETCYPQPWADGRTYCLPNSTMTVAFSDAACTQRVGVQYIDPTCPSTPSTYMLEYAPDLCASYPDRLYQRGAMISGGGHYYLQPNGGCNGPYADPNYRYFSTGGVVPTSALIEMTESAPSAGTRYSQRFYESTDGARVFSRVHDSELDVACSLGTQGQDATSGTCAPNAYYASYFQDSQCLQPKLDVSSTCPTPEFAVTYPTGATCPGEYRPAFYPVGGMADTTLFRDDGGGCSAQTASPDADYYTLGTVLTLPAVPRVRDTVAGRRIQLTHYHDGATRLRDYATYDEMLGSICYPFQQQDQTIVCMPFQYGISTYYADPTCTTPIDLIEQYRGDASCATPTPPEYAVKYIAVGDCDYTYEVHTVGTMVSSAIYQDSGGCNLYNAPQSVFFRAGPVVPSSELASATLVIDP